MDNTTNYGYNLPEYLEDADIVILNQNFTAIDKDILDVRQIAVLMYDSNETYNEDDLVGYENPTDHHIRMFRCLEDNVTGVWDSTKWTNTNVAAELLRRSGSGTEVEANPTGTATDTLVKIKIGNTIYAVSSGATALEDLTDVDLSNLTTGQILVWDGDEWVNSDPIGGASELSDLDDVDITTPTEGQILEFDGDEWVNADAPDVDVTKTAGGNPVEFEDGADAPLVKCTTAIQGNQDLHGYDKPWVGGAGINLIDIDNTNGNQSNVTKLYLTPGTYYCCRFCDSSSVNSYLTYSPTENGTYATITTTPNEYCVVNQVMQWGYYKCILTVTSACWVSLVLYPDGHYISLMISKDATAYNAMNGIYAVGSAFYNQYYSPYSNICPITAYTEGEMTITGKNIYNATKNTLSNGYYIVYDTGERKSGNQDYKSTSINDNRLLNVSKYIGRTLYSNFTVGGSKPGQAFYDKNFNYISGKKQFPVVVPEGAYYLGITTNAEQTDVMISVLPIEDYEPYTSTTHTATFSQSIYQGNADFVGGEATADMMLCDLSDLTWNYNSEYDLWVSVGVPTGYKTTSTLVAELYPYVPTLRTNGTEYGIRGNQQYNLWCRNYDSVNAPSGMMAYELATPTTETITPTNLPIKSLFGYNHIESTTGDLEVEYITQQQQPIVDLIESSSGGDSQHHYSTTEQVVGTWIDGSAVYEKTVTFTAPSNSYVTVTTDITDFDKCVGYSGIVMLGNGFFEDLQYSRPDSINSTYYTAITADGDIFFKTYEAVTGTVYITMRYTKTASQSRSAESFSKGGEVVDKVDEPLEEKKVDEPLDKTVDEQKEELTKEEQPSEPISEPLETKTDSLSKDEEKAEIEDESKEIEEITEEPEVTEEEPTEEPVDPEPSKEEADER